MWSAFDGPKEVRDLVLALTHLLFWKDDHANGEIAPYATQVESQEVSKKHIESRLGHWQVARGKLDGARGLVDRGNFRLEDTTKVPVVFLTFYS